MPGSEAYDVQPQNSNRLEKRLMKLQGSHLTWLRAHSPPLGHVPLLRYESCELLLWPREREAMLNNYSSSETRNTGTSLCDPTDRTARGPLKQAIYIALPTNCPKYMYATRARHEECVRPISGSSKRSHQPSISREHRRAPGTVAQKRCAGRTPPPTRARAPVTCTQVSPFRPRGTCRASTSAQTTYVDITYGYGW